MLAYGGSREGRSSAFRCVFGSHERRRGVGAHLEAHDRREGFLGLGVDVGVNSLGGTFMVDG
jgi:hypothetical protein